jgi:phosphoglycolate phosphatase
MKKKVVIFDMDGVLFDSIPYAKEVFMGSHPGMTEQMYNDIHRGNFHEEAKKYSHLKVEQTEEEWEKKLADYAKKKSQSKMFAGTKELLNELNDLGFLLALNTNAYSRNCFPLLENAGIQDLFDFVASAEVSKDKVEKFRLIQERYGVSGQDLLFVTDALGDVKDAGVAGVPTVAVTWGVHDATFFDVGKYSNLVKIVDTVEDLSNAIKNYFGLV